MTARDDSTRTAVVDDDVPWRPMGSCPPHRRCILRNASGSPCFGVWDGRDQQWTGWHPMPVVPDWMRGKQMTDNEIKILRDMLAQMPPQVSGRVAWIALDALLDEVERLRRRNEVLWNALWKASGDHEPHVAANLESVGGNPADFLDADMDGEPDDRQ